jgi:uncharacterized lipoprotein YddW (UPF0748 family)
MPDTRAQNTAPAAVDLSKITVPAPRREFRGVWAASVENIDWPSRPGLSTEQQKAELITLLDRCVQLNLNAVLLQVRPAADALYKSDLEPWSDYLTGEMGKAPEPFYDPLAFAVEEAHKRGLELHAWFNPFRARQAGTAEKRPASTNHVSKTHPDWVRQYGRLQWLDPGDKGARDHSVAVVLDVVKRYDVDGVHIDDYFYPYKVIDPVTKQEIDFPDDPTWAAYQAGGGTLGRSDWRRSNIDDYVERMYKGVKAAKPWVKVGISPFGIWRPGNPYQIKGFDSYEQLYGDSRRWIREGWADYFTPQLYWPIAQTPQSFPVLLQWWLGENTQGRHMWPGLFTSQALGANARWPQQEVEYQIKTTRGFSGATGDIHFSARFLLGDNFAAPESLASHLLRTVYSESVPVPASPWLTAGRQAAPSAPQGVEVTPATVGGQSGWTVRWKHSGRTAPWQWVVQWRAGSPTWNQAVLPGGQMERFIPTPASPAPGADSAAPPPSVVAVTAVDRVGRTSAPVVKALRLP